MNSSGNINKENPLLSVCFNIFIPVMVLKNGENWILKIIAYFDDGDLTLQKSNILDLSSISFIIALTFPIAYFIYDLLKQKNVNIISIFGFINVLLTGGIGIFGAKYGLSKNWFIFKESFLPLFIGSLLLLMRRYKQGSFNKILLNDALFDNEKIGASLREEVQGDFEIIVRNAGNHFIFGLFISSIIQFFLASMIVVSDPGESSFNEQVATMTWVSYLAVLVPTILIVGKGYWELIAGMEKITGLKKEDFLKA